jgi:hypothetical protein
MTDELKPCPFCGSFAIYTSVDGMAVIGNAGNTETHWCSCSRSQCMPDFCFTADQWNTRPLEDTLRAELAAANQRAESAEAICAAIDKYTKYHQPLDWGVLNDLFDEWRKETK